MRSPLEHEPELITGLGLITARWAALERELAGLLGSLLKIEPAGDRAYYALGSFSARLDMVEAVLLGSLNDDLPKRATKALCSKIRRLWSTRNGLIHSHYVYASFDWEWNYLGSLAGAGPVLGEHPRSRAERGARGILYGPDNVEIPQLTVVHHGFAYEQRFSDGRKKWAVVNRGTFDNHAAQLSKRIRQIRRFTKAVQVMDAPLRWGSFSGSSHAKLSPRGLRNRQEYEALLETRRAHQRQRQSSQESEESR